MTQNNVVYVQKEKGLAFGLTLIGLLGVAGLQHFYLGKTGKGILWLLTLGFFYIGTIIDLFTIGKQTRMVNMQRATGVK